MNALRHTPVLLLLLVLAACSRQTDKPAPATRTVPARVQYQSIAEVPAELRAECESFARKLEQDLQQGETQAVRAAFHRQAIVDAICEGVDTSSRQLSQFRSGLLRGILTGTEQLAETLSNMEPKFKHLVIFKGGPAARFRFISDQAGITIIDLALGRNSQGKLGIVGFLNHALGYDMVEQARQTAAPMLAELDKDFLERLFGQPNIKPADLKKFGELSQKLAKGDLDGVITGYKSLPTQLRESLTACALHITALQRSGNNQAYKAALKDAAAKFKAVNFQLMLVDAYYLDKQYDKAAECVDAFMKALEKDAALLALKSLLQNEGGDVTAARATLQEALRLEPNCVYVHSKALDVFLAAKEYPAARDSMIFLEEQAGYDFKETMTNSIWADFKKAPESARWR